MENTLYYGDNLDVLRIHIKDESIDLVYLDPPFKSDANYNILFEEKNGTKAVSQIQAFSDTWTWTQASQEIYNEIGTSGEKVAKCLQAFWTFLGPCDMLAYLVMMAPRLIELKRVLKPTGSIYLHCDPTASHYLKMLMDSVFGPKNFRNDIIWHYSGWNKKLSAHFESRNDNLLYYSKTTNPKFNSYARPWKNIDEYIKKRKQKIREDNDKRQYVLSDAGGGKRIKRYLDEAMKAGAYIDNVWNIDKLNNSSKERLGYPTQKPQILLERIIQASSNPGDIVLDPFCGCGTTIAASQSLNRKWIGIDITHLAITLIKKRLKDTFGDSLKFKVIGEPTDQAGAKVLAVSDPYQFQWWALSLVDARPVEQKKGADKGIDGRIIFQGDKQGLFESVIISVKAGHINVAHVRDLKGVLEREKAVIGVLISMEEPTRPMKEEAVTSGFYESNAWGKKYPKVQLLTIEELLNGKQIEMPPQRQLGATFKKAPKADEVLPEQDELFPE